MIQATATLSESRRHYPSHGYIITVLLGVRVYVGWVGGWGSGWVGGGQRSGRGSSLPPVPWYAAEKRARHTEK